MTVELTQTAARFLHLAAQDLLRPPHRRARKSDVLAAIVRMQLLQIDTIHVVARSPYLVLFSRLGGYPPVWLDELLATGELFETWAHEACFAPMDQWTLLRRRLLDKRGHWALRSAERASGQDAKPMRALLDHIRDNGPVRSADFERPDRGGGAGWWQWKQEKRWLEAWFALGELMVDRRDNFHRVYDLSERVLRKAGRELAAMDLPDTDTARRQMIERSVLALGIARAGWIADYYRLGARVRADELDSLVDDGRLLPVAVRGWPEPAYVHTDHRERLLLAAAGRLRATRTTLLSPFDPVVWDRDRAGELFGFDYRLECYVPAEKRRHGYFVLPILDRGRLVGRVDAKAHRRDGVMEFRRIALESTVMPDAAGVSRLALALKGFADWHGCPTPSFGQVNPRGLAAALKRSFRG